MSFQTFSSIIYAQVEDESENQKYDNKPFNYFDLI